MIRQWFNALLLAALVVVAAPTVAAEAGTPGNRNVLENLTVATSGDQVTVRMAFRDAVTMVPPGFTTANPSRVALDLLGVDNGLARNSQTVNQAYLRTLNLAQSGDRLRLVLNLDRAATYDAKIDGRDLYVTLTAIATADPSKETKAVQFAPVAAIARATAHIRDVSFRRGKDGEARVLVDLDDAGVGVDIQKQGGNVVVDFSGAAVPDNLVRKLDVTDFSTPVSSIVTTRVGDKVRMTVTPRGLWEHIAYQSDNQFVLEVRPLTEDPSKLGGGAGRYQGERLSLRFRDYPVKEVLHAFSDFSSFNIVVSEAVTGTISLNLQDVPWDQALDIILQQKNLAMRKNGNVMMIAPQDEILARNKVVSEAATFELPIDAIFQVNYIPAAGVIKTLTDYLKVDATKTSSIKLLGDSTSNKIFIRAPESVVEELRRVLREIDLPPRQVLIEARIVEAGDNFSKSLGVRMGYSDLNGSSVFGSNTIKTSVAKCDIVTGECKSDETTVPVPNRDNRFFPGSDNTPLRVSTTGNVNFPISGGNTLSFFLTNHFMTRLLSVELSALEADGRGKIISSPRVLAQNGQAAKIEDGTEIPYLQASSSGATSVSFKKATLSLTVTPTINADGRVSMDIQVNKDSPGQVVAGNTAINTKSVNTKVVVDNGGTVVIGGIYTEDERNDESRIPFFGDLPYVGFLFKNREKRTTRTELLVFITPRIVNDQLSLQ